MNIPVPGAPAPILGAPAPALAEEPSSAQSILQPPILHPHTAEFISLTGWQVLLSWLEGHAPQDIHKLAYDLSYFEFYLRLVRETGCVPQDMNAAAPEMLLDFTNRLSALHEW
jgi:hypothetical protein